MWNRNTVFHLITFNQNYYLQICLQFTLTLWFSILTSATPPNCIIHCNLCVAIRTKAYLNQCFWIYFNNFGIYNFWNGEAFSSLSVNSMLILLLSATVVDSVDDLLNCKWFYLRIFPFEIYFCFFNCAKVIDDYVSIVFAASKPFNFFFSVLLSPLGISLNNTCFSEEKETPQYMLLSFWVAKLKYSFFIFGQF